MQGGRGSCADTDAGTACTLLGWHVGGDGDGDGDGGHWGGTGCTLLGWHVGGDGDGDGMPRALLGWHVGGSLLLILEREQT